VGGRMGWRGWCLLVYMMASARTGGGEAVVSSFFVSPPPQLAAAAATTTTAPPPPPSSWCLVPRAARSSFQDLGSRCRSFAVAAAKTGGRGGEREGIRDHQQDVARDSAIESVYLSYIDLDLPPGLQGLAGLSSKLPVIGRMFQHQMIIVKLKSSNLVLFDFEPLDKTSPLVAATLLLGGRVPGRLRSRELQSVPRNSVLVGNAKEGTTLASIDRINGEWDCNLRLLRNDCRHYCAKIINDVC